MPGANATLVAVTDVDQTAAKEVADEFGAKLCADMNELLRNPDIQAVYIATPNFLHKEQTLAAAAAGKHVLCEKPLAVTCADIQEMISACDQAGVLLGVGFMMRFNVYHRKIRDMIQAGALGSPVMARGQMTCWYPPMEGVWRQNAEQGGGGCIADMGTHAIDVLEMLFGRTRSVFCRTFNRVHDYAVEDTAILLLEFESGVPGVVDVSFAIPDEAGEFVLEVYGGKGAIKGKYSLAQGPGGDMRACILQATEGYDAQQAVESKGGYEPLELETKNTYESEIEAFSQAILDGTPAPVSGRDGLWNHIVLEAAYESARTGKVAFPRMR